MKMKKAFSLLELIVIIIVVGIVSSIVYINPVFDKYDEVNYEKENIKQDLIYLKQLNLNQDFFESTKIDWYNKTDCVEFNLANKTYTLRNLEIPIKNPFNSEPMKYIDTAGVEQTGYYVVKLKHNITVKSEDGTNIDTICFDNLGRPFKDNLLLSNMLKNNIIINIEIPDTTEKETIVINKYTGFIK